MKLLCGQNNWWGKKITQNKLVVLFVAFLNLRWQWDGGFTEEKHIGVVFLPCTYTVVVAVVHGSHLESSFYLSCYAGILKLCCSDGTEGIKIYTSLLQHLEKVFVYKYLSRMVLCCISRHPLPHLTSDAALLHSSHARSTVCRNTVSKGHVKSISHGFL